MADLMGTVGSPSPAEPALKKARKKRATSKFRVKSVEPSRDREADPRLPQAGVKKRGTRAVTPKPKMIRVTLSLQHSVNGMFYGPGSVLLPELMAREFLNIEGKSAEKERSLMQEQAFVIVAGPYGPMKKQVPWAKFSDIMGQEGALTTF